MPDEINRPRSSFVGTAAIAVAAAGVLAGAIVAPIVTLTEDTRVVHQMVSGAVQSPVTGEMPALDAATEWLNSPPLAAAQLPFTHGQAPLSTKGE